MDDGRGDFLDDVKEVKDSMNVASILEVINTNAQRQKPPPIAQPTQKQSVETKPNQKPLQIANRQPRPTATHEVPRAGLQNFTTRLSSDTMQLLKRVVLQQQLKNKKPDTRQDVIDVAIREWAARHGYLREKLAAENPVAEAQGED